MFPPNQGFHAEDAPSMQINLRLEQKEKFLLDERVVQFLLKQKIFSDGSVYFRCAKLDIISANLLGATHCCFANDKQRAGVCAIVGIGGDADAAGDPQRLTLNRTLAAKSLRAIVAEQLLLELIFFD